MAKPSAQPSLCTHKFWGQVVLRWVLKDGQDCSRRGQAYGGRGISKGAAVGS